jgi:acyl-CoA synthetase (AMP-forming)/AMP-acid ligase II
MGYANGCGDLARGDEMGGTIYTGDMACRDADGDYTIVGRLKRFIKLFGHSVHLQDIEEELAAAGHAVACAGVDDQLDIYLPLASAASAASIKAQLVAQFKISPAAIRVWGIEAIPRNEAGKIQYAELTALHGAALA